MMDPDLRCLFDMIRDAMVVAHRPSGRMTSLTPEGGPSRHQCVGCGEPIWRVQGAWRNALTDSDVCTGAVPAEEGVGSDHL